MEIMSSSDEEELLLLALLADEEQNNNRKRKKRKWIHDKNLERKVKGEFYTLVPQLQKDEKRFYKYFRMTSECFYGILNLITNDIRKESTNCREPIPPVERLAITLRCLATGDSYSNIACNFRVGYSTVSSIVTEVCDAIWLRMQPIYMPEPTEETWKKSAERFYETCQFPNCIGSIDGKHVGIKYPNTMSSQSCYSKGFSIVLMAIVGADYEFLSVDIGDYGRNDESIFEQSIMGQKLESGILTIPKEKPVPDTSVSMPYVLIGDEAFPLKPYLLRPFYQKRSNYDPLKENYNTRLRQARKVVQNAFGILARKWRMYYRPLETKVETAKKVVKATCVLHNYLRSMKCDDQYVKCWEPPEQQIAAFRKMRSDSRRAVQIAIQNRQKFVDFFNS